MFLEYEDRKVITPTESAVRLWNAYTAFQRSFEYF